MPSYGQLDDEAAWREEFAPQGLVSLSSKLKSHWPDAGIWIRGDNEHLSGYHRSRRWIQESAYCENHSYSVSRTSGDRSGGNQNWSCAMDVALDATNLQAACRRLDAACRAGALEKITEWFGNLGNGGGVDGWDNISNRSATADSSHLTHLHMSFDRGRANEDHTDVFLILIGEMDVNETDVREIWQNFMARNGLSMADNVGETLRVLRELAQRPAVPGDPEAMRAMIRQEVRAALDATKLGPLA